MVRTTPLFSHHDRLCRAAALVKTVCRSSTVPLPMSSTPVKMGRDLSSADAKSTCALDPTDADVDVVPLEFTPPFRRLNVLEELEARAGKEFSADLGSEESAKWLVQVCEDHGVTVVPPVTVPRLLDRMISHWIEPNCIQPTFLYGHPTVMSPLAKSDVDAKVRTETLLEGLAQGGRSVSCRFELFVGGKEIVNAYEELNDPDEQRRRFTEQLKGGENDGHRSDRGKGDEDSQLPDEEFCKALEFGLPPTGGWGMGIDRVVQLLTGMTSIKEVVAFPMVRPSQK
ncbi:MAG: hypothetical protein BJ554DRAFT_6043 [Olpidium bornovanus]|uniref:Aminoacyl-tRNA synthetase class II (D/K/N) domain-containing protein n=1 Tax=Olpidium bornovanus TaxID=278681 RepID=A0A8H7ZYF6_9FUNG|nr:MAG: hypothetical protein BJ554DRAFT_6043 [Olpidium bornovanus]